MSLRTSLSRWHWKPDTWRTQRVRAGGGWLCRLSIFVAGILVAFACAVETPLVPTVHAEASQPDFGPNVYIFNPSMPQSEIQATVNAVANQQVSNQFGPQRYALLFEPGTYGSRTNPLNFRVGYYTTVAGLGPSPNDVVINGSIDVYNRCLSAKNCTALVNFWRSLSNLAINVTTPKFGVVTLMVRFDNERQKFTSAVQLLAPEHWLRT